MQRRISTISEFEKFQSQIPWQGVQKKMRGPQGEKSQH